MFEHISKEINVAAESFGRQVREQAKGIVTAASIVTGALTAFGCAPHQTANEQYGFSEIPVSVIEAVYPTPQGFYNVKGFLKFERRITNETGDWWVYNMSQLPNEESPVKVKFQVETGALKPPKFSDGPVSLVGAVYESSQCGGKYLIWSLAGTVESL
ncbi:MAG: hypothetical protein K1X83_06275 [Oligoflexia bacterium]|nr:hypothetical protein [Oligoflexia bacterium]